MNDIIENDTLKWLFISGKGGVGKTTLSSSIAIELTKHKKNVLLVSLDPAHSTSDFFQQTFSTDPILVNGYSNLYCIEYNFKNNINTSILNQNYNNELKHLTTLFETIPGIDEALGYISLMKFASNLDYSIIIFDTAPTGHTLKLLSYPSLLKESYHKLIHSNIGIMFKHVLGKFIMNNDKSIEDKLCLFSDKVDDINNKLTDTNYTQFVCVTLPEYLSVYEMERFIQKVLYYNIDCKTIIINKIIEEDNHDNCIYCSNKYINQEKYLDVIDDLYSEDFNIIYIPRLINVEIKNVDIFTSYLYNRVDYLD